MKPEYHRHGCPVCGHRVKWSRLGLRAWLGAEWECDACGARLQFDPSSRGVNAGLLFAWVIFLATWVRPHVPRPVFLVVALVGGLGIWGLERVVAAPPGQASSEP